MAFGIDAEPSRPTPKKRKSNRAFRRAKRAENSTPTLTYTHTLVWTHAEPPRPTRIRAFRRASRAEHKALRAPEMLTHGFQDPRSAVATHPENNVNRVERFGALRAPKRKVCASRTEQNTNPWPSGSTQSRRDPPRGNRKSSPALREPKNSLRASLAGNKAARVMRR